MKRTIFTLSLMAMAFAYSCKSGQDKGNTADTPSTETTSSATDAATGENVQPVNEPTKVYTVVATPDTVLLGKNNEAFIRIKDIKAVGLSDPDGKFEGMELVYKIELTNKKAIGDGSNIGINTGNFRLELDNGQKIAPASIYVSAQPEETKTSEQDKFTIPAGAKPVGLSLFMDGTRATIKFELK
ncbi:MAG: hypothetical protein QM727_13535 [Niabella sp.]